ncbi:O-antigen ligase family protein [Cupriavidus sp. AcVe19-6a]|nr:O-antigen ligase family protein [Cupriavidus sp. AcVe19-6a]
MIRAHLSRFTGMEKVFSLVACAALISFPILLLTYPSAANAGFSFLLLWCVLALAVQPRASLCAWGTMLREHWAVAAAMAALPAAFLLRQVVSGDGMDLPYLYLRFALFGLLAWGLALLDRRALQAVQWGLVVGAIVSAIWIYTATAGGRPDHVGINNIIPFSNLSLLMGMLAMISIGWDRRGQWLSMAPKLLAGAAGVYTSYASATRGGWLAIPVLLLIAITIMRKWTIRARAALLAVLVGGMAVAGYCSDVVRKRVNEAVANLNAAVSSPGIDAAVVTHRGLDTSEGWRLQLWKASLRMLETHPMTGVGPDAFEANLKAMAASGIITPATTQFAHSHNDVLYIAATQGIPGVLAVLALYLVPAGFFLRHLRSRDMVTRTAATMGLAISIGFLLFGLTEAMFFIAMTNAFYTLMIATCFAIVVAQREAPELPARPGARAVAA